MIESFYFEDEQQINFSKRALTSYESWLTKLGNEISQKFPSGWMPDDIRDAQRATEHLKSRMILQSREEKLLPLELDTNSLPYLLCVIEFELQNLTQQKENTEKLSHRQEPQDLLDKEMRCGESILKLHWISGINPVESLHLANYFNLETLTNLLGQTGQLAKRIFDEKFHLLMEPSLFTKDLKYFIDQCGIRKRPVSIAFIDIDHFKEFNTELTHTIVDRDVLPYLMRAIEGFVFGRGFAYRQGGDEYLVSIPNVEHSEALEFFESLRKHIETIVYQKTLKITNPTISIGVVTVESFDRKTASELLQLANVAVEHAKTRRNCVAGYVVKSARTSGDLYIYTQ